MKRMAVLGAVLLLAVLSGCMFQPAVGVWLSEEEVHPGDTVTVNVTPIDGGTYQYEVLRDGLVIYTRQVAESSMIFTVEWWPWAVRVTVFNREGVASTPITLAPILRNESPVIYRPKESGGDQFYGEHIPLESYVYDLNPGRDQYGNRTGVWDEDEWHIVSVEISEPESAPHLTTIVTWPYQEGVWQVGGLKGQATGDPIQNAFEVFYTWCGKIRTGVEPTGRPWLPIGRGQGYWTDPLKCHGKINLAAKTSGTQTATMTITVEDKYGAQTTEVFEIRIGPKTC